MKKSSTVATKLNVNLRKQKPDFELCILETKSDLQVYDFNLRDTINSKLGFNSTYFTQFAKMDSLGWLESRMTS